MYKVELAVSSLLKFIRAEILQKEEVFALV